MVNEKLEVLCQLGILTENDHRKHSVEVILANKNEIQIDNWCHDIIVGNKTLDEALYGGVI